MEVITMTKEVQYYTVRAYDGTVFSTEAFGSLDAAKEAAKKYEASAKEASAKSIVASKAMKVLKPYKVPGSDKLSFDAVPEATRKNMTKGCQGLFDPTNLAVQCIVSELATANWGFLSDIASAVYIFKPKKQSDIDIVAQYCTINGTPINDWVYKEADYSKDLAAILNHYHSECTGVEGIKVGHMYLVTVIPEAEVTSVIDIENVIGLWTELLNDVKENY